MEQDEGGVQHADHVMETSEHDGSACDFQRQFAAEDFIPQEVDSWAAEPSPVASPHEEVSGNAS